MKMMMTRDLLVVNNILVDKCGDFLLFPSIVSGGEIK
jgi:hypothetical protein